MTLKFITVLDRRELTLREAGKMNGIAAADNSRIRNADLGRFTLGRLVNVLARLDHRVEMRVVKVPAAAVIDKTQGVTV